jgi:hypothetical protein
MRRGSVMTGRSASARDRSPDPTWRLNGAAGELCQTEQLVASVGHGTEVWSESRTSELATTASISTRTFRGSADTCTVERAGRASPRTRPVHLVHHRKIAHASARRRWSSRTSPPLRADGREDRARGSPLTRSVCAATFALNHLAGGRIDCDLPRGEEKAVGNDLPASKVRWRQAPCRCARF